LAVDNEPEPFWTGADEVDRVENWMSEVGWSDAWGTVAPVSHLNGPSGLWVEERILGPLGTARADAWITDCLNTYRASVKMRAAVEDVYLPFARAHALPSAELAPHPSEGQIVSEGIDQNLLRLQRELTAAAPDVIVTLGNAALRVLRKLLGDDAAPTKLTVADYGIERLANLDGNGISWLPLAHPAAPERYQVAHETWMARRRVAP
jgi:uracil-DNA glycosylase